MTESHQTQQQMAVIGFGTRGGAMAARLVQAGFSVTGDDLSEPARQQLAAVGGLTATTPAGAVEHAACLLIMVATAVKVYETLAGIHVSEPPQER